MSTAAFQRLLSGEGERICTVVAFAFAGTIFLTAAWQAVRMRRSEAGRLSSLPFGTPTPPASGHDRTEKDPRD